MNQYDTQQPISAQPQVQPEQVQATDPITQAALATIVSLPKADVALNPVTATNAVATTVSLPRVAVPETPVTTTGIGSPKVN